jgi:hypothetical protein
MTADDIRRLALGLLNISSPGERKGPAPQAWEGEEIMPFRSNPSPSHCRAPGPRQARGRSALPLREKKG